MHMKRSMMPGFWPVEKKAETFVTTPAPGPHKKAWSFPLIVALRDVMGVAKTAKEARTAIKAGKVFVDKRAVGRRGE